MATVSVRYIVNDVGEAIAFYCQHLGFTEVMHPAPAFAMLSRGDLRLVLSAPGAGPGGGQAMPDGTLPAPAAGTASRSKSAIWTASSNRCASRARASGTRSSRGWAAARSCSRTPPETRSSSSSPPGPRPGSRLRADFPLAGAGAEQFTGTSVSSQGRSVPGTRMAGTRHFPAAGSRATGAAPGAITLQSPGWADRSREKVRCPSRRGTEAAVIRAAGTGAAGTRPAQVRAAGARRTRRRPGRRSPRCAPGRRPANGAVTGW